MSFRPEDRWRNTRAAPTGQATAHTACHVPAAGGGSALCPRICTCRFLSRIKLFLDVLMKEVLHPESRSPNGVRFHCIDVYLDELSKVGGKEVSHEPSASAAGTRGAGVWGQGFSCSADTPCAGSGRPRLALCPQPQ